ncbi:MAG TPA: aconitate hydratase AcnA [Chloroflexota bacterium]|nr:aconitate hydratase AcnA [Chloroflexota bacterium]
MNGSNATPGGTADPFGARGVLTLKAGPVVYYRLGAVAERAGVDLSRLPMTVKIILENLLRHGDAVSEEDILAIARWSPATGAEPQPFPFWPARVLMQDLTGVPAVVDLAAMRAAAARAGADAARINPLIPTDLVIDHSVQVDRFGSTLSFSFNREREFERNRERYAFLRWAQQAFDNFSLVPPDVGICHQVNLEYLAKVVQTREENGERVVFPDTLVGTDSHTTMVNGLGVLGWGVGGIEAEAALLGQPLELTTPVVIGFRFHGDLPEGTTATDLVLTVTEMLRKKGVVGKFVEFSGPGLSQLSIADRATLSNMAPEYGATAGLFPVDAETLRYLRLTGRPDELVELVEAYTKEQGLFRTDAGPEPVFDDLVELDLATVVPSMAGPKRPQDRITLGGVPGSFAKAYPAAVGKKPVEVQVGGETVDLGEGAVAIAAITSCTNTSNPSVMVGAGLLAKKAVERGLRVNPSVKTSLAPGSRVVTDYLERAGLMPYLEALGFHLAGYGCTTCIGNSGPLPEPVSQAVADNNLTVSAVLSGNRNFEGRIHPQVKASYLASPPLVVAYALAGNVNKDLVAEPIGADRNGEAVYLKDIWPTQGEIRDTIARALGPDQFKKQYAHVFEGGDLWESLPVPTGALYEWDPESTYIREPNFFDSFENERPVGDIVGARALAVLGDSITTDHISPASAIPKTSPAARYLIEHGVPPSEFNSYGARRGNHEVMVRGTFGNIRLRNALTPEREGDWTVYFPTGEVMHIFDASERYQAAGTPLIVVAGKEYGSGSSRDWAAKGPMLLGIKAAIAETYERIHRSNLVGMGVLPLQFLPGENLQTHGLTGTETFDILGLNQGLQPRQQLTVRATRADGNEVTFAAQSRLDTPLELGYYRQGGILPAVLKDLVENQ